MDSSEHNETDFLSSEIPHNDGQSLDSAESVPVAQDPPLVDELNTQLDILKKQLAETQKLTALGELVGTTTHEFNNILMTVLNYAKMGMRHKDDQTRDKAFDKILAASQRAAKITNAVLGMARNRSDIIEPTDLGKVIEDALVLLEREMSKYRISMEIELMDVPETQCNGNQIQQVLLNLLTNARQAMDAGGTVWVKLEHHADENMNVLTVRDSGCGIPQEELPRIFDPFYSTKAGPDDSGKGGTGLGLSSCLNIIEAHQGHLKIESTVGIGTQFIIQLPIASDEDHLAVA
ncbi:MAG: sensor histidine kinase [Pirellulaceae bacterium]|nr:ATP-binding protein [Pirellulales bacterium]